MGQYHEEVCRVNSQSYEVWNAVDRNLVIIYIRVIRLFSNYVLVAVLNLVVTQFSNQDT